jgi:hypothetical protein
VASGSGTDLHTVNWLNNDWDGCHLPAEDSAFAEAELLCGVTFPADYKECARVCHGGRPRNNAFVFTDPDIGRMESCVGVLLSYSAEDTESFFATFERLRPFLPPGAVPIADDGGGDFICLAYGEATTPTIGYWSHGAPSLVRLAPNFTAFLQSLYGASHEFQPA